MTRFSPSKTTLREHRIREAARKAAEHSRRTKKVVPVPGGVAEEVRVAGTPFRFKKPLGRTSSIGGLQYGFPGGSANAKTNRIAWRAAIRLADTIGVDPHTAFEVMRQVSKAIFEELMLGRATALPHIGVIRIVPRGSADPERERRRIQRHIETVRTWWTADPSRIEDYVARRWGKGTTRVHLKPTGNMRDFFAGSVPPTAETNRTAELAGMEVRYRASVAAGLEVKPPEKIQRTVPNIVRGYREKLLRDPEKQRRAIARDAMESAEEARNLRTSAHK